MKNISVLLLLAALLVSCECLDCKPLLIDFHYTNHTDTVVEISIDYGSIPINPVDERVEPADTLKLEYAEAELEEGIFGEHVSTRFKFMSTTATCLTYSGATNDSLPDPRAEDDWTQNQTAREFVIDFSLYSYVDYCER